ncbi:hypothetical protein J1605_020806 [Eschrichtius robustus]|uniref:Uncharacterized protein n=1 Tax=Eschrichtius robustus TaxID=9764 RepID=A0AB34HJG2_ESCRO|nr:hypothetical protein J1605_020806 [Eschrichtius robustus]
MVPAGLGGFITSVLVSMHCDTVLARVLWRLPNSSQPAAPERLPAGPQPRGHRTRARSPASAGTLRLGLVTPAVACSLRDPGPRMPCSFTEEHQGPRSCSCAGDGRECRDSGSVSYFWYRQTLTTTADINDGGSVQW